MKCPDSYAGATESPLASPRWFFTLGLKPSLQRLWRSIMLLLANNRLCGELVEQSTIPDGTLAWSYRIAAGCVGLPSAP